VFSPTRQGVEDDDLNVVCLDREVIGTTALALKLIETFLGAYFSGARRHPSEA